MNNKFINSQSAFGELWNETMSASGVKLVNIIDKAKGVYTSRFVRTIREF